MSKYHEEMEIAVKISVALMWVPEDKREDVIKHLHPASLRSRVRDIMK